LGGTHTQTIESNRISIRQYEPLYLQSGAFVWMHETTSYTGAIVNTGEKIKIRVNTGKILDPSTGERIDVNKL
jgi:hypothetical protein